MKKRERAKRKDNIIFLPGLEKRLTDKGLESLQNKRYREAITLLEEAKAHDPENSDILIGLVLAYFEAGAYIKAKDLANEMLLKGIGEYFHMVDLYLTILIQLHEYQEIVSTIEALFDEKEIPPDRHDHFLTILQFSKRMADNSLQEPMEEVKEGTHLKELKLSSLKNLNEQMLAISSLAEKNIRPYMDEIKEYLNSESGHPFLKTMLLTLLKEQEYDKKIEVKKFNEDVSLIPTELPDVQTQPRMKEIEKILEAKLENSDPVLFENMKGMVERIFFISYPFELKPEAARAWAAAFHLLVLDYLGGEPDVDDLADEYEISTEKIEQALAKIRELEEISYPNI
ncbi:tetratricopeptide repeat protein [Neobacillus sp. 179-C4.2 HS]|uniref:Tetratricopeptide repeat protein n=1 Tax=Neobacillus driksii TaxID=3035913 RepID=A0ABV4YNR4_9BACI|nr:tetratricopeptide repeat protein [Neobacillus sp. 179.-C4.2 HS]MDP5196248.1 tetratricopeptide repeat protein [Neobacillus sp. 179.-C4.2 HS]